MGKHVTHEGQELTASPERHLSLLSAFFLFSPNVLLCFLLSYVFFPPSFLHEHTESLGLRLLSKRWLADPKTCPRPSATADKPDSAFSTHKPSLLHHTGSKPFSKSLGRPRTPSCVCLQEENEVTMTHLFWGPTVSMVTVADSAV